MYDKKEQFYKKVVTDHADSELSSILVSHPDCGFYEVCQRYIDVGLNADKIKVDIGEAIGRFHDEDIEAASGITKDFISQYGITKIDEFLSILKSCYPHATDPLETRATSGSIMAKDYTHGTLFSFTRLPENIFEMIIKGIE